MDKHPYDQLIETVADKMKEHEDANLGFGIFEKVYDVLNRKSATFKEFNSTRFYFSHDCLN